FFRPAMRATPLQDVMLHNVTLVSGMSQWIVGRFASGQLFVPQSLDWIETSGPSCWVNAENHAYDDRDGKRQWDRPGDERGLHILNQFRHTGHLLWEPLEQCGPGNERQRPAERATENAE